MTTYDLQNDTSIGLIGDLLGQGGTIEILGISAHGDGTESLVVSMVMMVVIIIIIVIGIIVVR
jgi:hypothetical protein